MRIIRTYAGVCFCRSSDTGCEGGAVPMALLAGGVFGGLVGALIGGQFPKAEAP